MLTDDQILADKEIQQIKDKAVAVLEADDRLKEAKFRLQKAKDRRKFGNRPALEENVKLAETAFRIALDDLHLSLKKA